MVSNASESGDLSFAASSDELSPDSASPEFPYSERALRTQDPAISYMLKMVYDDPEIISLAAGLVDEPSLPHGPVKELFTSLFTNPTATRAALQYGPTAGHGELRTLVARRLVEQNGLPGPVDPDDVVITNGSQQLLHLVTDVLVDPGDIVLVEDPTYFVYMGALEAAGAQVIGVATDEDGILPDALEERLQWLEQQGLLPRLKIVYIMTYFQNPMGVTLREDRRKVVVDILERWGGSEGNFILIEDAAYRDLRIDGPDLDFLKKYDPENRWIVLTGTFSKAFAPGLRLGWGYLPKGLTTAVLRQKGNQDFGSNNLGQTIAAHALKTGQYDQQKELVRQRYKEKRDVMVGALREHWPKEVSFYHPRGGLYVWVTLPEGVSANPGSEFFNECLKRKVIYVPGYYCFCKEPGIRKPDNTLRLCYGYTDNDPIVEGIRRMGEAIATVLERQAV